MIDKNQLDEIFKAIVSEYADKLSQTKDIIESVNLDYYDTVYDNNEELDDLLSHVKQSLQHLDNLTYCLRYQLSKKASENQQGLI